jgi:osmotically-inducible protein OsmY
LSGSFIRPDEDIARAVANVLEWNVLVPHEFVKVQVQDGVVTLNGKVDRWYQKDAAGDAVGKLVGVVAVMNYISIKPAVKPQDVKDEIVSAFQRNALLDARRITVETSGSWIVLKGSVHTWAERAKAQWVAWAAPGVAEVENNIIICP